MAISTRFRLSQGRDLGRRVPVGVPAVAELPGGAVAPAVRGAAQVDRAGVRPARVDTDGGRQGGHHLADCVRPRTVAELPRRVVAPAVEAAQAGDRAGVCAASRDGRGAQGRGPYRVGADARRIRRLRGRRPRQQDQSEHGEDSTDPACSHPFLPQPPGATPDIMRSFFSF
nr:hypothetical protein GCM10020092_100810 [Actinoplanes digitatis]